MKNTIKIISVINLIFMVVFIGSLLFGAAVNEFLVYALCIAFLLGIYQVLSIFILLFSWDKFESIVKKYLLIYLFGVVTYFLIWYLFFALNIKNFEIITYFVCSVPVLLALYFTFIIEIKIIKRV